MTEEERKEKHRLKIARLRAKNPEKYKAYNAAYRLKNLDKIKEYQAKNKEKNKAYYAKYRKENPLKIKAYLAKSQAKNKDKLNIYNAKYQRQRRANDPIYAMATRLRIRLSLAFKSKGYKKQSRTQQMLGCSYAKFIKHIENQFSEGMNWDNRSEWHLDHIIPLSCATTIEGIEKLSHYSNIRPLWANENLAKSDNLVLY